MMPLAQQLARMDVRLIQADGTWPDRFFKRISHMTRVRPSMSTSRSLISGSYGRSGLPGILPDIQLQGSASTG
jgi:hypothetical protein